MTAADVARKAAAIRQDEMASRQVADLAALIHELALLVDALTPPG